MSQPESTLTKNRRIARNTLFLYIRMFIMMFVSLFTSRIILQILGVEDFGIYNLVGGIVVLFSFLNTTLSNATQRFLNFEMGRNDETNVSRVFSMSMTTYLLLSVLFFILAETIGLWFLNAKLNIPPERMEVANWVYQFSIVTFIINLLRIPYNASIIAYEKMGFYAYNSIVEAILKLGAVYLLYIVQFDKLIVMAALFTLIPLIINIVYKIYCNRAFPITRYNFFWDKELFLKLTSFSGWNLFGSFTSVLEIQGVNILFNIYYGVVLNAAMGVANQVTSALNSFTANFQIAFTPQIVKLYAQKDYRELYKLINRSSKFSFLIFAFPCLFFLTNMHLILNLWLVETPEYAEAFCQWLLITALIGCTSGPFIHAVNATGEIKYYQLCISFSFLLDFILSYALMSIHINPGWILICRVFTRGIINFMIGLYFMNTLFQFPISKYLKEVLLPILSVLLIYIPISLFLKNYEQYYRMFLSILVLILLYIYIAFIVLNKNERNFFKTLVNKKLKR